MPSLLMVTVWSRLGGAERLILQLLDALGDDYRVALGYVRPAPPWGEPVEWPGRTVDLREVLFGRWDVIHTHLFLPGLLVRLRRLWDGSFRWVHTVHYDSYPAFRFGRLKRWLDHSFVYPAVDELVAVSPSVRDGLPDPDRTALVLNAIDLTPPTAGTGEGGPGDARRATGPVVGTVAMLRSEKGLELLVRVAARLRERRPGLRVRIAGAGPRREPLERLIAELGVEGTVILEGFVEDLDAFYRGLDVYVQPSRHEPFGLAALEALRFGLPAVVSDRGHLPALVGRGRWGEVVPLGGPDPVAAWTEALDRLLVPDARAEAAERAREAAEHWRRELHPDRMEEAYREVYRRALLPAVCAIQPWVTHRSGGLQRQLFLQTRALARRGHRIFLLQRRDPGRAGAPEGDRWSHVRFLEVPGPGPEASPGGAGVRLAGVLFVLRGLVRLWGVRRRVDVLHAHQLYSPGLLAALGRVLLGTPAVARVTASGHMGEEGELRRLPFTGLRLRWLRRLDRVFVLSAAMEREVLELGLPPEAVRVLPNAVEVPESPAEVPRPPGGPFRVLYVGRLSREKSLHTVLEAAARVGGDTPVEVHLVGGPPPERNVEGELRRLAAELPEGARAVFHGERGEVEPFYRAADLFVLPSLSEGMSNALLEAMAIGLPCAASDIPENRELLRDGVEGWLFPVGDADALARLFRRGIRDRNEHGGGALASIGAAARERVRARFSTERIADELEGVYDELVARPGPAPRPGPVPLPRIDR